MIANHIVQNQEFQNNHEETTSDININDNVNQSNIAIHQIEHPNTFRNKCPYKTVIEEELPELDSKLKKDNSNLLTLARNIDLMHSFYIRILNLI